MLSSSYASLEATTILTQGAGWTGGIGNYLARWLIDMGAGHIVLVSHHEPNESAIARVAEIANKAGTTLHFITGDIGQERIAKKSIAVTSKTGSRVRGIFHAAGTLADGLLHKQSEESFERAFNAKVRGAWHLHQQTKKLDLDAFVLFSSSATVFGPPAQSTHAAACASLDRLSRLRHVQGLQSLSIGWGPWQGIGKAAELGVATDLTKYGILPVEASNAITTMCALVGSGQPVTFVSPVNWNQMYKSNRPLATRPIFAELVLNTDDVEQPHSVSLANSENTTQLVCDMTAQILLCDPKQIDSTQSLKENGFDSIMVVELREQIERDLGVELSLIDLFSDESIERIVSALVDRLNT